MMGLSVESSCKGKVRSSSPVRHIWRRNHYTLSRLCGRNGASS